mgnify:CR=1 FL=1
MIVASRRNWHDMLMPYFDWTPFFRAWELAGTYPAILDDAVVGESARSLYADARAMLSDLASRAAHAATQDWRNPAV